MKEWINNRYRRSRISLLNTSVEERRLLSTLHKSSIFKLSLLVKLLLIFFFTPLIYTEWFEPFLTHADSALNLNPWQDFLRNGGDISAFPYGIGMYILYAPLTIIGSKLDSAVGINFFTSSGLGLTTLLFDYGILLSIALWSRQYSVKILLLAYWCSPVILYILYWHGQLDSLPVLLLALTLVFLDRKRTIIAGILFGISISAKFSMVLSLPFILIYLIRWLKYSRQLKGFCLSFITVFIMCSISYLASSEYVSMVFQTQETSRVLSLSIDYGESLKLYLMPTAYLVIIYMAWRLRRTSFDLLLISIGIGFFTLLLLVPPSPGWFLWVYPFIVFYQVKSKSDYLALLLPFILLYIIYYLLYSSGSAPNFAALEFWEGSDIYEKVPFLMSNNLQSILFTSLQASGLLVCLRMYIYGISRNTYFSSNKKMIIIGLAGNFTSRELSPIKEILSIADKSIFKTIDVDRYLKQSDFEGSTLAKYRLNPLSHDLSCMSSDIFEIISTRTLRYDESRNSRGININRIISEDTRGVLIYGLHSLELKRLRDRINLKVYINSAADQKIEKVSPSNNRAAMETTNKSKKLLQDKDYLRYDSLQKTRADLIFDIKLISENSEQQITSDLHTPKRKLIVVMENGYFHEKLVHSLIALCGMHIDIEYFASLSRVKLVIEGDISKEDINQLSTMLIPNVNDLVLDNESWVSGYEGLIQLIIILYTFSVIQTS